jgi:PilX N-terminal
VRFQREKGVALITALLVLIMISAIAVGLSWMVMTDLRLGGNNQTRETAYYGAEAGMEKLTADVGTNFITNGSLSTAKITSIMGAPPSIPLIQYLDAGNNSTYQIMCGTAVCSSTNPPTSNYSNILAPSPYAGMSALITTLGLQVAAQTETEGNAGGEVKLQRQVQLVAIPVFQFGVFSQTDLAFFNSPSMDFIGRVHTNGNLWLGPEAGPLNLHEEVTASGQVIRTNLENGWPGANTTTPGTTAGGVTITTDGSEYGGYVNIGLIPNPAAAVPADPYTNNADWRYLSVTEGSLSGYSVYGNLSPTPNTTAWQAAESKYNGMLVDGTPALNLSTTALSGVSSDPIFLIRRPVVGEQTSDPPEFNQQYFSEVTLRILLDDYATPGVPSSGCHTSDMMSLNGIDTSKDPVDLATLATTTAPSWWSSTIQSWVPLPAAYLESSSRSTLTTYTPYNTGSAGAWDGYWVTQGSPIITGCIKIEYQDSSFAFHDITQTILNLGFTGRNINPQNTTYTSTYSIPNLAAATPVYPTPPFLPAISGTVTQSPLKEVPPQGPINATYGNTTLTAIPCTDPSMVTAADPTGPIIRLERVRDNPSSATSGNNYCGSGLADTNTYDYWPMALYDTREGGYRPFPGAALPVTPAKDGNMQISAQGVMYYVELDAANLAAWLAANQSGLHLLNATGYGVYFSDRRGEQPDTQAAVASNPARTGSFGFNDVTNPGDAADGCPNFALNSGEDLEQDGTLRTYGAAPTTIPYMLTGVIPATSSTNLPSVGTDTMAVMQNPNCSSNSHYQTLWPGATFVHVQEARENPALFFRRALKIVDGANLTGAGTSCYGTGSNPPCGLTIASENPVYVQGDYNAAYNPAAVPWTTPAGVAASVVGDAVTLLSDNWNDVNSFIDPYDSSLRAGKQTAYRMAIISGKGMPFPWPGAADGNDFGTDGGVQNFPRLLEDWGQGLNYMGSMVSMYFNRQAVGLYGYSNNATASPLPVGQGPVLYKPPTRNWSFDTNFTKGVTWLPPLTPVLRSINTTGFSQMLMPTQ